MNLVDFTTLPPNDLDFNVFFNAYFRYGWVKYDKVRYIAPQDWSIPQGLEI